MSRKLQNIASRSGTRKDSPERVKKMQRVRRIEERQINLNAEQKRAVETLDGPLLIVAGPGTGKTQLLSISDLFRQ